MSGQYAAIPESCVLPLHLITQDFIEMWEQLDKEGTGFLDVPNLTALLLAVDPPMGIKGQDRPSLRIQAVVQSCNIPLRWGVSLLLPFPLPYAPNTHADSVSLHSSLPSNSTFLRQGRHIHFLETLHELAARVAGSELPQEFDMMINDKMVSKLPKVHVPSSDLGWSRAWRLHPVLLTYVNRSLTDTWPLLCLQEGVPRYNAAGGFRVQGLGGCQNALPLSIKIFS